MKSVDEMNEELAKTLNAILKKLVDLQVAMWNSYRRPPIYGELESDRPPITKEEMERLTHRIRRHEKVDFHNSYLYLPGLLHKLWVPIISLRCDFKKSLDKIYVELQLFRHVEKNADKTTQEIRGYGFRFEGPHHFSKNDDGKHKYYHVQLITKSDISKTSLDCYPSWISEKIPCFPAGVNNPVSFVLLMLVSLYGKKYVFDKFTDVEIPTKYKTQVENVLKIEDN